VLPTGTRIDIAYDGAAYMENALREIASTFVETVAIVGVIVFLFLGSARTALVPLVLLMRPKGSSGYSGRLRSLMVGAQFFISATLMILAIVMFSQKRAMTQQLDAGTSTRIATGIGPLTTSGQIQVNVTSARVVSAD